MSRQGRCPSPLRTRHSMEPVKVFQNSQFFGVKDMKCFRDRGFKVLRCSSHFFCLIGIVCLLVACGGGPKATAKLEDVLAQSKESQKEVKEFNQRLFSSVSSAPRPE